MRRILAVLVAGLLVAACRAEAAPAPAPAACRPDVGVEREVAYGAHPLQALDVYPAAAQRCGQNPVVIWVHGGGWRSGDKARLGAKRAWAAEQGRVLVSVNYRLTPPARYPDHNEDVGAALTWVVDHIEAYGGDADRVALIGHSAGAQIVSSVGVDERYGAARARDALRAVVSLDTEGYDVAVRLRGARGRAALVYRSVFGNRPAVWADASPIRHVDADDPAQLVVRRGTLRRQRSQQAFAATLRAAGVPVTVVATPGWSHRDVNVRLGSSRDRVLTPEVDAFLDEAFAP